ncbi:unnamed protein product [Psylliodes chrysocephalus]|uniref:CCHC-type domain-containing protein n=1 Tax=Psylliodes chrysocephalus TaxID=3402493 RepID=A0A9P0D654_9CUCU|nr:unnamed protein product [Psylliodes chrysocephala]
MKRKIIKITQNIKKTCVKCSNNKCSVIIHYKCFETVSKLFFTERKEWKCKSCIENCSVDQNPSDIISDLKHKVIFNGYMKRENELLSNLNHELKLNNDLLQEKVKDLSDKLSSIPISNSVFAAGGSGPSFYSDMLKKPVANKMPSSSLLIQTINKGNNSNVLEDIQKCVNPADLKVCINGTKKTKNGLIINCDNQKSLDKLKTSINNQLGKKYTVSEAKKFNPRLIIKNVHIDEDMSYEEIANTIFSLNQMDAFSSCDLKIVTVLRYSQKTYCDIVLEVSPLLRNHLLQKSFVHIGWKGCPVNDYFRVVRCYKCSGLGHEEKNCEGKRICPICADEHSIKDCKADRKKCSNCFIHNSKYKTSLDCNHAAKDTITSQFRSRTPASRLTFMSYHSHNLHENTHLNDACGWTVHQMACHDPSLRRLSCERFEVQNRESPPELHATTVAPI